MTTTNSTIAVLGLGAMGLRMAQRLLAAGFEVRAYNRTPERGDALAEKGAVLCPTPRAAVQGADLVLSMVRDDEASQKVWLDEHDGALEGMEPGAVALEASTVSPAWVARLSAALNVRGVRFLDAPVVGTRPHAEAGTLVFLVGGEDDTVAVARPALEVMGHAIHHLGRVGSGSAMKLAVNALFATQVAALGEQLGCLAGSGIEPAVAMELLGGLAVTSPAAKGAGGLMVKRQFDPLFPVELVAKDLSYASAEATRVGTQAPLAAAAHDVFTAAIERGWGGENLVAVAKLYEPSPAPR